MPTATKPAAMQERGPHRIGDPGGERVVQGGGVEGRRPGWCPEAGALVPDARDGSLPQRLRDVSGADGVDRVRAP